jgi:4-amino-4-deoxy-L-arabinose transferase-like glycosyltransferase
LANKKCALLVAVLLIIAVGRILLTYSTTAQAFDEPCHVAAALEFLDHGTYSLDPVHPPLARIAIGIPLYLAGERYPLLDPAQPESHNYNVVGNHILYDSGHYVRNLALARSAMLPFFVITALLVFLWTRLLFGNAAAIFALALFSTLPVVLGFTSIAYTDVPAACTQFAAIFAVATWIGKPSFRSTILTALAVALALLAKLTSVLFLPVAAFAMFLVYGWMTRRSENSVRLVRRCRDLGLIAAMVPIVVWAGYGFSVGHMRQTVQGTSGSQPSFQHFPGPLRAMALHLYQSDPPLPAPDLLHGAAEAWVLNRTSPPAYLLGQVKNGGWWYFFLVGILFKTPLAFLLLCSVGVAFMLRFYRHNWSAWAPLIAALAILVITTTVKYNAGLRHVLVVFPLLSVSAGAGCAYLWSLRGNSSLLSRVALVLLLGWQVLATAEARRDFLAYFNELAGPDPSRVLVAGCDLDCGQDLFRLADAARENGIAQLNLAVWSSADLSRMGLPPLQILQPFQPRAGWVAISLRSLRFGDVLHSTYPPGAFDWLNRYQPVARVGKTILLYRIPEATIAAKK